MWKWQPDHHKLSIHVALRTFCCQALCSEVSVTGYCVVICVPIFRVWQCCKSAFLCARVCVCWRCVYQCFGVIIKYLCGSCVQRQEKKMVALISNRLPLSCQTLGNTVHRELCTHLFWDFCAFLHRSTFNTHPHPPKKMSYLNSVFILYFWGITWSNVLLETSRKSLK